MGPARITEILALALQAWCKATPAHHARVVVARDPFDVLELLTVGPQEALIVVLWAGGDPVDIQQDDDDGDIGPERNAIEVTVGYALGLDAARDWRLILDKGNRKSVLGLVAAVRAHVLSLSISTETAGETAGSFGNRGTQPVVTPEGLPLAAYKTTYSIVTSVDVDTATEIEVED